MKFIEHRRHTAYASTSRHLNQRGIDLARKLGTNIGPFDLVLTSTVPRAFETAIAMGFEVNDTIKEFSSISSTVNQEIPWDAGFRKFAEVFQHNGATTLWVKKLARVLIKITKKIPQNGSALIISHGGIVEGSTIGCYPNFDYSLWDRSVSYCEGVKLTFKDEKDVSIEFLETK